MIITTATGALRVALTASAAEKVVEEETAFSCSRAKVVSHRRRRHHRRLRRSGGEEQATERPKQNASPTRTVFCVFCAPVQHPPKTPFVRVVQRVQQVDRSVL